jgi:HD domain-containing protein
VTARSTEGQWSARPWLAALVRIVIVAVPVAAGTLIARLLAGPASGWSNRWVSVAVVLLAAVAGSVAVSRLTNRLLPLALLLRMTLIFPDQAPSRIRVARQTTSLAEIEARLRSRDLDESEAATTTLALVTALERHDRHTRGHSERVRLFCDLLSAELGLSPADAGRLRWAALIHDIGKLEVPAGVLAKPGKLNAREWLMIRQHPDAGARLAAPLQEWLGPWFSGIAHHHERYDGLGYPRGLEGTAISLSGRAIAVVDAFETMTAARAYKAARTTMAARAELTRSAGSHFDPVMVRAFLRIALPRLVWTAGPLAFVVNAPYLAWLGQGGRGISTVVTASTATAANVAGVAAVAVAVSAAPSTAASGLHAEALGQPHHYRATHGQRAPEPPTSHKPGAHHQAASADAKKGPAAKPKPVAVSAAAKPQPKPLEPAPPTAAKAPEKRHGHHDEGKPKHEQRPDRGHKHRHWLRHGHLTLKQLLHRQHHHRHDKHGSD